MAKEEIDEDEQTKKEGPMGLIIGLVVVSLLAVGTGWFVGSTIGVASIQKSDEKPMAQEEGEGEGDGAETPVVSRTEVLEPIVTNLMGSDKVWMRLELTVVLTENEKLGGEKQKAELISDLTSFLQTVKMQHISGPSGIIHLKEDLIDRARISTQGRVEDVLITSMVVE